MPWLLAGCVVCGLTAVALLTVVVSMTYEPPPGIEPPKVTDWMQGWGSLAGVVAGAVAAVAASWLLLHERQQAREAREQLRQERVEAEKMAARAVQHRSLLATMWLASSGEARLSIGMTVTNYGAEPVRGVVAIVGSTRVTNVWVLHVGEVIGPGDERPASGRFELPAVLVPPDKRLSPWGEDRMPDSFVTLRFFDSRGREWERTDNGTPERALRPLPMGDPPIED
ncbi:hypothetical protein GCE86_24655 [Micromonospora terminaliae]|uniref:Uncharacterized protein n=1 Tax=Micromonospora terminaliae TaxID=1914461 RepID=A0AAJ3DKP5_9ACTN|nr:hypothetical protein [Micromonospora terminaliae]NES29896.1 hypothetical protein [Micromonospora terminaliae]QGL49929.1 hypothetical protein GCE86_24655 [Micromonospora terminaliae]